MSVIPGATGESKDSLGALGPEPEQNRIRWLSFLLEI